MPIIENLLDILDHEEPSKAFNPYKHQCQIHDKKDGVSIRRSNLRKYMEAMIKNQPRIALIGEALGYRGGRRTGLPFTSDLQLPLLTDKLGMKFNEACIDLMKETTATAVWKIIDDLFSDSMPFLWNIYPFQPYKNLQLSNRNPGTKEIRQYSSLTQDLLSFFQFDEIVAIGKTAYKHLKSWGYDAKYVRHPSHGGARLFVEQMELYIKN